MTFYIELGSEAEELLRRHAERLGRPLDEIISEKIEELVCEHEAAEKLKSARTNST